MEHDIYGITRWGDGLVGVLENGNVALNDPLSSESKPVDLVDLVEFSPFRWISFLVYDRLYPSEVDGIGLILFVSTQEIIERFHLDPHPEGGWFRRTYESKELIESPNGFRPAGTSILYMLNRGEVPAYTVWMRMRHGISIRVAPCFYICFLKMIIIRSSWGIFQVIQDLLLSIPFPLKLFLALLHASIPTCPSR